MKNIFTELQESIAGILRTDEWIGAAPAIKVSTDNDGSVAAAIDKGLKGNGCAIVVMTPRIGAGQNGAPDTITATVLIGIAENPMTNRGPTGTGKCAQDVATSVLALLWDFTPPGGWQDLEFRERVVEESTPDLVAYALRFETSIRVKPEQVTETSAMAAAAA